MNGHLVTIEVCVERRTHNWMKLYSVPFNEFWFERLYGYPVKSWSSVQKDHFPFYNLFQNLPGFRHFLFDNGFFHFPYRLARFSLAKKFCKNKWFEEFHSHFLWYTTLMYLEVRSNNYHRSSRVVDSFSKEVSSEPSLLSPQKICQGFQRSSIPVFDRYSFVSLPLRFGSVVYQSVNSFLEHSLFVSQYYLGSSKIHEPSEPVVSVYDPPVEFVEIRCCKPSSLDLYHGS